MEFLRVVNRLTLNYTKTFKFVFEAPNKQISNPEDLKLELGNQELETEIYTRFLGIQLDSQNLCREQVSKVRCFITVNAMHQTIPS